MRRVRLSDSELVALLALLDDEDEQNRVRLGDALREVELNDPSRLARVLKQLPPKFRTRTRAFLDEDRFARLYREFEALSQLGGDRFHLEDGVLLLARFGYPALERGRIATELDAIAADLGGRLNDEDPPVQVLRKVTGYLFEESGFRGNARAYYDPDNSYFNRVLDTKLGVPITLSALVLFVARRLGLPFVGVGLPGHFIVAYRPERGKQIFIDPFHKGRILTLSAVRQIVSAQGVRFDPRYLESVGERAILARMIANLVHLYSDHQDRARAQRLTRLFQLFA